MALQSFGETGWDDSTGSDGSSDFFNMRENKKYRVRLLGNPHKFAIHWVAVGAGKRRVTCAADGCILCAKGTKEFKAQVRYIAPAYVHNESRAAILEFGPQVYGAIKALATSPDWGNPKAYDIVIDKDTRRGLKNTYMITPGGQKSRLKEEQVAECNEFLARVGENLKSLASPSTNEIIMEKLGEDACIELGLKAPSSSSDDFGSFSDNSMFDDSDFDSDDFNDV